MQNKKAKRESWGSSLGFMLAAIGSAVGLGNLWGFPYKLGMNGGFAFLILYLILAVFAGYVLIMTELSLGRKTNSSIILAYHAISKKYTIVGWFGALAPFFILGFYSYLGGYCLKYTIANLGDLFGAKWGVNGMDGPDYFAQLSSDRLQSSVFTAIFLVLTIIIVARGLSEGIERFNKIAMPALFFMLLIIIIRSVTLPGASEGIAFLFKPNFSVFKGTGWITVLAAAGGQVFFSLSLGMGILVTYGSYMKKDQNIERSSLIIPVADTVIALMAGLAIMPAVFASGQSPQGGVGLLYMTLQTVFNGMGKLGPIFGVLFYGLVVIAAITSSMSVLEAIIGSFIDYGIRKGKGNQRKKLAWIFGLVCLCMGLLVACDGLGKYLPPMFGKFIWLDGFDLLAEGLLMPFGAFITTIIFGWVRPNVLPEEVHIGSEFKSEKFYRFCIKWVAPIFTFFILIGQLNTFFGLDLF
ncbi:sodium-dependent transporter [Mogibacterium timidum]|uniref:Sodium:neurotransmitter symporter domain protein n=1 Tax=Mogibacterium timidum ATCC 33093 TaxID=1401079 RepID=X8ITJ3_9FIRM|nr:sodium-dependent transporter [Mogibacterium timidum]EUC52972.1 sodium:neurotransmitter symporter domain protein [Mogibacterium timidum ATCC 33093]